MQHKPAFDVLVRRHGPTVLRVCRAVVGRQDADDAWSETFLSALKTYPDLPSDANVEAWLVTIAHRRCVDLIRAKGRLPLPTDDLPESSTEPDPAGTARDLADALAMLTDRQRRAVAYHYLAGLPYREVAGVIGGSEAAARRAAADGIACLRRLAPDLLTQERTSP